MFALYDLFDNHFMMQSHSYDRLFKARTLMRSKTMLEVVDISAADSQIDNSVIENWGLQQAEIEFYTDSQPRWEGDHKADLYFKRIQNKKYKLIQVQSGFDDFKRDLQQQIFFVYHCLTFDPNQLVLEHLAQAVGLGIDSADVIDRFLNLTDITDQRKLYDNLIFLKMANLFYE